MTIESKKDLPKRYQELADEAGFKAVLDSLDKSPADMTAVAEVEKQVEQLQEVITECNLDRPGWRELSDIKGELKMLDCRLSMREARSSGWETYVERPESSSTPWIALWLALVAFILAVGNLFF